MLKKTFKTVLKIDVNEDSVQSDFPLWDSLGHIRLILQLEKDFNITINFNDIYKLTSYKAIQDYLLT